MGDKLSEAKKKLEVYNTKIKTGILSVFFVAEIIFIGFALLTFFNPSLFDDSPNRKIAYLDFNQKVDAEYTLHIMEVLKEVEENDSYKAIFINFDSPGGDGAYSKELYEYLKYLNKKKPVTIYVGSMAASGAYYIASAVKPIYANPHAIVGSIGVRYTSITFNDMAKKLGIGQEIISVGKSKVRIDLFGSFVSEKAKQEYLEKMKQLYEIFLNDVAQARGIPVDELRKFANGEIFIANDESVQGVLVDKLTTLSELRRQLEEKYDAEFVKVIKKDSIDKILDKISISIISQIKRELRSQLF